MSMQYITYNEKKYPVKLGIFSLQELQQKNNLDLSEMEDDITIYKPVLFLALQLGARISKQELDIPEEDMDLVLDECLFDFSSFIPDWLGADPETMEKLMAVGGQTVKKKAPKKSTSRKSTAKE